MDMDSGIATSKLLNQKCILSFQHAASGFPEGVTFKKDEFVRPQRHTPSGLALLCKAFSTALANIPESTATAPVTITDSTTFTPAIQCEEERLYIFLGSLCTIAVLAKNWCPKMISRYTTPDYDNGELDDILDYSQYGKCMYKSNVT